MSFAIYIVDCIYIFRRKLKVQTDHKPLQWVGKLKVSLMRITQCKKSLSQYNMEIIYKPGRENIVANWLSRVLVINAIEDERGEISGDVHQFLKEWTGKREGK